LLSDGLIYIPSPNLSPHDAWKPSKALGGERDLKAHSLYPAKDSRMVFEFFRGEGWGEGPCRVFKHSLRRIG
jgi:hypothetical protein